jgi:hypothetical protein
MTQDNTYPPNRPQRPRQVRQFQELPPAEFDIELQVLLQPQRKPLVSPPRPLPPHPLPQLLQQQAESRQPRYGETVQIAVAPALGGGFFQGDDSDSSNSNRFA